MKNYLYIILFSVVLGSCTQHEVDNTPSKLNYTVSTDSALYYFYRGWEQIMDEGDWTGSEASYRKAMALDPDFLVAKSLLGRITSDSSERKQIHEEINQRKEMLQGIELQLLNAYNSSLAFIIQRDRGNGVPEEVINNWMKLSENTLGTIAHLYPDEPYTKAEYVEFLHSLYGARIALDSLNELSTPEQKKLGFYINYAVLLHSELGEYDSAFKKIEYYLTLYPDSTFSSSHAYYAQIYYDMDSLTMAQEAVNKALKLEPNHIIAQRLIVKIEDKINGQLTEY